MPFPETITVTRDVMHIPFPTLMPRVGSGMWFPQWNSKLYKALVFVNYASILKTSVICNLNILKYFYAEFWCLSLRKDLWIYECPDTYFLLDWTNYYSNEEFTLSFSTEKLSSNPFARPQTDFKVFQIHSKGFATKLTVFFF